MLNTIWSGKFLSHLFKNWVMVVCKQGGVYCLFKESVSTVLVYYSRLLSIPHLMLIMVQQVRASDLVDWN